MEGRETESNQTAKDNPTSRCQIRTKVIQPPRTTGSNNLRSTKNQPLRAESLSTPLQPQRIAILRMWIWKGDGRALPHGMQKIQGPKEGDAQGNM